MKNDSNISPIRFLIILITSIAFTEVLIMILFLFIHFGPLTEIILDTLFLIMIIFPTVFLFSFRPLVAQMKKAEQIKNELMLNRDQLTQKTGDLIKKTQQIEQQNKETEERQQATLNILEDLNIEKMNLEKTYAKDQAILESIGEGLIAVDDQRKILVLNEVAENMLGWKAEDMIGQVFMGLPFIDQEGNSIPVEEKPIFIALKTGKTIQSDKYWIIGKNGTKISLGVTVTPVILRGQIIGAVIIFRDISKEKEVDRAKTEFVSLASHQLRTPLGISKWYLEALRDDDLILKDPKMGKGYLDEIYNSNERLIKLVGDLLNVSRIDQSRVKNEPVITDIVEFVKIVFKELEVEAQKKGIKITFLDKTENLPKINIDQEKFREVLENLISNSIKYTEQLGQIEFTISNNENNLQFDIKDNGIGIPKDDQSKIFTRFFRTAEAAKKDTGGSGLGLYIVKSYIEGWGGKIWFKSEEGKGTVFHFNLPLKPNF